jgi:hypothetical protein
MILKRHRLEKKYPSKKIAFLPSGPRFVRCNSEDHYDQAIAHYLFWSGDSSVASVNRFGKEKGVRLNFPLTVFFNQLPIQFKANSGVIRGSSLLLTFVAGPGVKPWLVLLRRGQRGSFKK